MNLTFLVPMIVVPEIIMILLYAGLKMGLFTTATAMITNYFPAPITGFILGGGIGLGVFVLVACVISIVCYYPFVKMADKKELEEERALKATV
ncbi:Lichenan permease IIC component [compost metagenome]